MPGSHADGEQLARVSRRGAALLIDFLVWVIVVVFIVNISGVYIGWSPTGYMAAVAPGITLGFIVLGFIYFIVCERIWGRTTWAIQYSFAFP